MTDPDSFYLDPDILWNQIRESERTAPANRPVVLVIEDDPNVRLFTRHALRDVVRTDAASTVRDALRMAESVPYDGLLVNLHLPDGNGTEVVSELRDQTPYWGVPMIAVTAEGLPEGSGHFLEAGFDAYVAKPFKRDELRTLVRHLVVTSDDAVDRGRKLLRKSESQQGTSNVSEEDDEDRREPPATRRMDALPGS